MRLDRFISNNTSLSRSQAQRAIRMGKVLVNGQRVRDPARQLDGAEQIKLHDVVITPQPLRYIMLNKPSGYVCAGADKIHPTVMSLLDISESPGLHIVGRLDMDTTGLLLLTDDGDWSHRVMSPRHQCSKTYRVELAEQVQDAMLAQLKKGVQLKGEARPTRPAMVEVIDQTQVLITVSEGKYHQIKRMFAAVGNHVLALHRESIGGVVLDAKLPAGGYRNMSQQEVQQLAGK